MTSYRRKAIESALQKVKPKADPQKRIRLEVAEKDFWFFASYYLPHYFTVEPAEYHKVLVDIINTEKVTESQINRLKKFIKPEYHGILKPIGKLEGIVDVEPREHAKSTRMSLAYPLWRVLTGKSRFILLLSASQEMANLFLENIKVELEENERILEDFGDLKGDKWKSDFITLKNGTAIVSKGAGASMRGIRFRQYRPDLVIADDIMKDDLANSAAQRDKLYRWFKRVVMALGKDAFIVVVNTIFHNDDLPSRLLREIESGELKNWLGLRFSAITPEGKPLWPAKWSLEDLEKKKRALGSIHFATEYLNEPLSDEDRLFKEEWITYYRDTELPPLEDLQVSVGVDPATGKQHGDFSAIVVVGKDKKGVIYVLYTYIRKVSPTTLMEELFRVYKQFSPRVIVFEEVAFQEVFKKWILEEGSKRGLHLPVKGVKPKGSKEVRATALAPLMENGLLKFKENQKELIEQLLTFPKGTHDDAVDALVYAVQGLEGSVLPTAQKVRSPFHYQTAFVRKTLNWLKNLP